MEIQLLPIWYREAKMEGKLKSLSTQNQKFYGQSQITERICHIIRIVKQIVDSIVLDTYDIGTKDNKTGNLVFFFTLSLIF